MSTEMGEIARNLRRLLQLLQSEDVPYDNFFEALAKAEKFSNDLEDDLLDALVDAVVSDVLEFSVKEPAFDIVRHFCQFQPVKVFEGFSYKQHNDFLFSGVVIYDLINLKLDVDEMNNNLTNSPNKGRYDRLISEEKSYLSRED